LSPGSGSIGVGAEGRADPERDSFLGIVRRIADGSPNAVVAVDAAGDVAFLNPKAATTFGYAADELVGRPIEALLPERQRDDHVVHRREFLRKPQARPMGIGLELAGRRSDGSEFPVEISLTPLDGPTGPIVMATVVDITARKQIESALAESEGRFRAVLEASPNAIVGIDESGTIVYANPQVAATFGSPAIDLIGQPIEMLLPSRVWERHAEHRTKFMRNPTARPMGIGLDLAGRRANGSEFPVEISLSPVRTADGILAFATIVDITARKTLQQELLQSQKMESVGRLAGGIAHDFNNMLSAISGHADILMADLSAAGPAIATSDIHGSIAAIQDAALRAASLTAQLLAFSRQTIVKPSVLDLRAVVGGLEPMLRRLIGERVTMTLALDDDTGTFRGDPGQVDQILVNLVVNARDAIPAGGAIVIESGSRTIVAGDELEHFDVPPGDYVVLAVSDNGSGMDAETREHIFEPFFTTKAIGKGTGLGLATIYGIVHQAGGHIWVYSEPGMGTTFKLFFPRVDGVPEAPSRPAARPRAAVSGRILVAEDDSAVREVLVRLISRAGYTVVSAADGGEALDLIEHNPIDVLVTDVVMPTMTGPELARAVLSRHPGVGVILVSGYTAESLELAELMRRGAQFVGKPFSSSDLLSAVDRARAAQTPG
jgi:PAS domain S-box-containing protein